MKRKMISILILFTASTILFTSCSKGSSNSDSSSADQSSVAIESSSDSISESSIESTSEVSNTISESTVISSSVKSTSSSKTSSTTQSVSISQTSQFSGVDTISVNSLNAAQLDAIKKETNLMRWDIAWAPTPIEEFFDFDNNVSPATPIWRGVKNAESVFENGDWGLILHALKASNSDTPAMFMYNKADISTTAKEFQVIARSNPLSKLVSGRGAFRIKVAYKVNGKYTVENLKVIFSDNQKAQTSADFKQGADGYVTFEAPPKSDKSDAFQFDISNLLGKKDVVFFVEANDRMDTLGEGGVNLPDRVIIAAMRYLY